MLNKVKHLANASCTIHYARPFVSLRMTEPYKLTI